VRNAEMLFGGLVSRFDDSLQSLLDVRAWGEAISLHLLYED
jgi:hypothetical protein